MESIENAMYEFKLGIIAEWEVKHYQIDENYKKNLLAKQPFEVVFSKLSEMTAWESDGGTVTFGGD